jgi:hypothetical protein
MYIQIHRLEKERKNLLISLSYNKGFFLGSAPMHEEPGFHLITGEQAQDFYDQVTASIESNVPIMLEEPEHNQSGTAECHLIIGSTIVSFLGSWEARSLLEKLVRKDAKQRHIISHLFIG